MKLTVKQLIQTICDLMYGNTDPFDIQRETGWDIEKCKYLFGISKACIGGEVEVEEINKVVDIYKYVEIACEEVKGKIINSDNYDMGMFRAFFLVRQKFDELFPGLKIRIDNQK